MTNFKREMDAGSDPFRKGTFIETRSCHLGSFFIVIGAVRFTEL